jgi:hypothetical protein
MGSMKDFFGDASYPHSPGYKEGTTSRDAAERMSSSAGDLRSASLAVIAGRGSYGATADEVAAVLKKTVLAIRPRITELSKSGAIRDSSTRRANVSGMTAKVWVVAR